MDEKKHACTPLVLSPQEMRDWPTPTSSFPIFMPTPTQLSPFAHSWTQVNAIFFPSFSGRPSSVPPLEKCTAD